jgi:hypothetical protein
VDDDDDDDDDLAFAASTAALEREREQAAEAARVEAERMAMELRKVVDGHATQLAARDKEIQRLKVALERAGGSDSRGRVQPPVRVLVGGDAASNETSETEGATPMSLNSPSHSPTPSAVIKRRSSFGQSKESVVGKKQSNNSDVSNPDDLEQILHSLRTEMQMMEHPVRDTTPGLDVGRSSAKVHEGRPVRLGTKAKPASARAGRAPTSSRFGAERHLREGPRRPAQMPRPERTR